MQSFSLKKSISQEQQTRLINVLHNRFETHMKRHRGIEWNKVQKKLEINPAILAVLSEMERTGGEPDVIAFDKTGEYIFCDCSPESPKGRRSVCYDSYGEKERKKEGIKTKGNAEGMAEEMGVELLDEQQYRELQSIGDFDTKTSSWLKTPPEIRKLGGAIFGDKRYNHVFIYHNGAQSFYASRGFRGIVRV